MSRFYYSHDLESIHTSLIEDEITPLIQSKSYLHNEIFTLFINPLGQEWIKKRLTDRFQALSTNFIMTLSQFVNELYSRIQWEENKTSIRGNHILMTPSAKTLLLQKTLDSIKEDQRLAGYFKPLWEYWGFKRDLISFLASIKKELLPQIGLKDLKSPDIRLTKSIEKWILDNPKLAKGNLDKYMDLSLLLSEYERIKMDSSLIDSEDMIDHIISYLLESEGQHHFISQTQRIYLLNVDSLSYSQLLLIKTLSDKGIEWVITFYYDPERPKLFSEGLKVKDYLSVLGFNSETKTIKQRKLNTKQDFSIHELSNSIFNDKKDPHDGLPFDSSSIRLIRGDNPHDEVIKVGKRVKSLLLQDPSLNPDDIAIVLRNPSTYKDLITDTFKKLKIPVYHNFRDSIFRHKLIPVLLQILELKIHNYSSETLMSFIKSNYVYLRGDSIDKPHFNTRAIVRNIDRYYQRIKASDQDILRYLKSLKANATPDNNVDGLEDCILYLERLKVEIDRFPAPQEKASIHEMIKLWREHIIDTFSILYNVYNNEDLEIVQRDSIVLKKFFDLLGEYGYFQSQLQQAEMTFYSFYTTVKELLSAATVSAKKDKKNHVHCMEPWDIQGITYKKVFAIGLFEGEFPKKEALNCLVRDTEKKSLNQFYSVFKDSDEQITQEQYYFFHCLNSAMGEIYFSYPALDDSVRETLPSFFLDDAAYSLSKTLNELNLDIVNDEFYYAEEVYQYYARIHGQTLSSDQRKLDELILMAHLDPSHIELIGEKVAVEKLRSSLSFSEYEGVLSDNDHKDQLSSYLTDTFQNISPSHLERYGQCPHRFFFNDILRLRKRRESEDTLSTSDKGNAVHSILYTLYQKRLEKPQSFDISNIDWVKKEIRDISYGYFDNEIKEKRQNPLIWGREFENIVHGIFLFVEKDITENKDFNPVSLEIKFDGEQDLSSVELLDDYGERLVRVRGAIDRIDLSLDESRIRVVDYKSGTSMSRPALERDIKNGTRFQPFLYSKKAQEIHDLPLDTWNYYYVLNHTTKKLKKAYINLNQSVKENGSTTYNQLSEYYIRYYLKSIHKGHYHTNPKENKCVDYCEFTNICRVDLALAKDKEKHQPFWESLDDILDKLEENHPL